MAKKKPSTKMRELWKKYKAFMSPLLKQTPLKSLDEFCIYWKNLSPEMRKKRRADFQKGRKKVYAQAKRNVALCLNKKR